jgi:hypothetical protein
VKLALVVLLAVTACGDDDSEVVPGRGISRPGQPAASTEGASLPATTKRTDPFSPPSGERELPTPMPSGPIQVTERVEGEEQGPERPRRDPAEELRALIGDPSGCLTEEDRLIERDIAFDVSATVLSSGIPSTVTVSSAGISEQAIACVRRRVVPARFDPFESMTTIQASVVLRRMPENEPTKAP